MLLDEFAVSCLNQIFVNKYWVINHSWKEGYPAKKLFYYSNSCVCSCESAIFICGYITYTRTNMPLWFCGDYVSYIRIMLWHNPDPGATFSDTNKCWMHVRSQRYARVALRYWCLCVCVGSSFASMISNNVW